MGVKDLWKILEPAGRPISPETLQGLVLGVDISLWLNQAIKGSRDRYGNEIPNAHLLVLFNRICKLMYYQIKPVFVFDGTPPALKANTLKSRRKRRQDASKTAKGLIETRTRKLLEVCAIQSVTGQTIDISSSKSKDNFESDKHDMFALPPVLEKPLVPAENKEEEVEEEQNLLLDDRFESFKDDIDLIDIHSENFASLPPEVQHDLLLEKKEAVSHHRVDPKILPKKATDFSDYQLMRVMKKNQLSRKLKDVRRTLNQNQSASLGIPEGRSVEANRILSTDERHYILIQGNNVNIPTQVDQSSIETPPNLSDYSQPIEEPMGESIDGTSANISIEQPAVLCIEQSATSSGLSTDTLIHADINQTITGSVSSSDDSNQPFIGQLTTKTSSTDIHVPITQSSDVPITNQSITLSTNNISIDQPTELPVDQVTDVTHTDVTRIDLSIDSIDQSNNTSQTDITEKATISTTSLSTVHKSLNKQYTQTISIVSSSDSEEEFEDVKITSKQPTTDTTSMSLPLPNNTSVIIREQEKKTETENEQEEDKEQQRNEQEQEMMIKEAQQLMSLSSQEVEKVVGNELEELKMKTNQQERRGAEVTSIIVTEAQELLKLFGLPYMVCPSEAEAQCAFLESQSLTQGTITDDNDVFLFGGNKVYRHVFSTNFDMEYYSMTDVCSLLGLDRDKLITLAYLLGSDYTDGLEGVGCVNALELIQHFGGKGIEPLRKIHQYHIDGQTTQTIKKTSALHKRIMRLSFPTGFPDNLINEAYIDPSVDTSDEQFEFGSPDLDLLRQYALDKFGWSTTATDKTLLPVIKRATNITLTKQPQMTQYFPTAATAVVGSYRGAHKSKRMRNAVARLTGQKEEKGGQISRKRTAANKKTPSKRGRGGAKQISKQSSSSSDSSSSSNSD